MRRHTCRRLPGPGAGSWFRTGGLFLALLAIEPARALEAADTVYRNGRIYTADERNPWAEAVAVRDGRFALVGTNSAAARLIGPATAVVDLGGRLVLPGLIDSHTHPSYEAEQPYHFETGAFWTFLRGHDRIFSFLVPAPSLERCASAISTSLRIMSSYGITAFGEGKTEAAILPAWERAIRTHPLAQHAVIFMHALDRAGVARLQHASQIEAAFRDRQLPGIRPGAKIFIDGNLEYRTAHLLEPYLDVPGSSGRTNAPPEVIRALVAELDRAGLPIQAHAIGDAAVRAALDAFESAVRGRAGAPGPTHSIVHARLVHPADLPRFARIGVIAATYPFLAHRHPGNSFLEAALGPERVEAEYLPLGRSWRAGAVVAASSDWASASMNPFYGMYVGVTRRSPRYPERGQMGAANALTLEQMVRAYTLNGAMALGMERAAGSIAPGKWADMAVLDRDIFRQPVEALLETKVVQTIFEGRVVYEASKGLPRDLQRSEDALLDPERGH